MIKNAGRTKRDNTSTSLKIRAEKSEEKREKTVEEMPQEEEEVEEDKEGLKDKPQPNKYLPNKQPPLKLEHVLCEYYLTSIPFFT